MKKLSIYIFTIILLSGILFAQEKKNESTLKGATPYFKKHLKYKHPEHKKERKDPEVKPANQSPMMKGATPYFREHLMYKKRMYYQKDKSDTKVPKEKKVIPKAQNYHTHIHEHNGSLHNHRHLKGMFETQNHIKHHHLY